MVSGTNGEFLKQEIYANLVLYNFGIFLANEAAEENNRKKRKSNNKFTYDVDISTALKLARKYFVRKDTGKCIDIIKLMTKYVHAVKTEFRQFSRPLRGIGAIHFGYRWHILTEYFLSTDENHLSFCRAIITALSVILGNSHQLIYHKLRIEHFIEHPA